MATRNIVPRADGEGNIGTALKNWLKGWFVSIFVSGNITDGTHSKTIEVISDHIDSTSNPHSVTKAQVGLTNVTDNAQLKENISSYDEKVTPADNDYLLLEDSEETGTPVKKVKKSALGSGATLTRATFTNANLSSGILTITHSKGLSTPYTVMVVIFDNNNKQIIPDEITGATNTVAIDLSSYGTLSGTWGYGYIA